MYNTFLIKVTCLFFLLNSMAIGMEQQQLHPAFQKIIGSWQLDEQTESSTAIKIENSLSPDGRGVLVSVREQKPSGDWALSFYEYILYDSTSDTFFALANAGGSSYAWCWEIH